ncbi:MAG: MerR family DNA-binding protein [Beduini sp.]|uniref:MerR family DNA-binding protein n=1 Tax=Beduini sp. TaxID=1922300 RepID=UPI0039A1FBD2
MLRVPFWKEKKTDEIDLFKPSYSSENGYRYYSIFQLDKLALIISLKALGMSLKEIKTYLTNTDHLRLNQKLKEREAEIDTKILRLQSTRSFLKKVVNNNETFQSYLNQGFFIISQPKEYYEIILPLEKTNGKMIITNYLTEGLFTGHYIGNHHSFLYRKVEKSDHCIESGYYLSLYFYDCGFTVQKHIEETKIYAQQNDLAIEDTFYIKANELLYSQQNSGNVTDHYFYRLSVRIIDTSCR